MKTKILLSVIIGLLILTYVAVACAPQFSNGDITTTGYSNASRAISYVENEYLLFKYKDMDTGYTCYIATTPNSSSALQLECVK